MGMHIDLEIPKTSTMEYICHSELRRRGQESGISEERNALHRAI